MARHRCATFQAGWFPDKGSRLRILHVTPSFYPAWAYGGIPRCAYELCRALVGRGAQVQVWTTDALDAERRTGEPQAMVEGIEVHRFRNLSNGLAYHRQLYLPRGLGAYARRHLAAVDVVHIHSHRHLLQPLVARPAVAAGIPYVFTGNGTVPGIERYVPIKRVIDAFGGLRFLRRAAACVAVCEAERQHYEAAGVAVDRVRVIPNGLRLSEFTALPARGGFRRAHAVGECPLIVFVGKITPRKGVDVLLRALARLPSEVQLAVAGNFMMSAVPIQRLVHELGIATRVRFVGFLSGDAKLGAYVDADVVAYPSVDEIFGLVPFEALMCGTPAVVCDDSGCAEVMHAANGGLCVPYGNVDALAAALETLLRDHAARERYVASGRRYVERHLGWDRIAEQTLALYEAVLATQERSAVDPGGHSAA